MLPKQKNIVPAGQFHRPGVCANNHEFGSLAFPMLTQNGLLIHAIDKLHALRWMVKLRLVYLRVDYIRGDCSLRNLMRKVNARNGIRSLESNDRIS